MSWAIVITTKDGAAPQVYGPYDSVEDARYAEDRYVDAPEGAWAYFTPIYSPADLKEAAQG